MESLHLLLSVFLMGLLPAAPSPTTHAIAMDDLPLAPPALVAGKDFPRKSLTGSLSASGVTILDMRSGQEIFARNAGTRRPMGSLTKIMTAVIIAESHRLDEEVIVPHDITETNGSTLQLPPGARFTVGDLLSAMLISSANDAADTLARFHSGSIEAFVVEMNERARALGLADTSFANPSGLDSAAQYSTPRDIAWLASFALRNPEIRSRMSTATASIRSREGGKFTLTHTHALLGKGTEVIAGKTGTTNSARQCLLSLVQEGGKEYLVVLLGSNERYVDMRAVLRVLQTLFA